MSPLVWDLAHIGNFEELWLLRQVAGAPAIDPGLDDMYDAFRHPRSNRPALPLLGPADARRYVADVRSRVVDVLATADLDGASRPDDPQRRLLTDGYVYAMVVQHEHQHDETMLATLQLMGPPGYRPISAPTPAGAVGAAVPAEVEVPAGPFTMGTDDHVWAYDNERPAHVVDIAAFRIDTVPVTNRAYVEFIEDGGYDAPRWWGEAGWAWRQTQDLRHPEFWRAEGGGRWSRDRFGWREDLPLDEPVQHVCWHEADAFARWAGKRLPTEAEWEKAASWTADGGTRRWPWGDKAPDATIANLDGRHYGPASAGAYPDGASAIGCRQMIGDVWEWTSSDFGPYPGYSSFPYPEYSEVFFGSGYKVLRGGSWATSALAIRPTFRNWDHPIRRQIFAGFRCARGA